MLLASSTQKAQEETQAFIDNRQLHSLYSRLWACILKPTYIASQSHFRRVLYMCLYVYM